MNELAWITAIFAGTIATLLAALAAYASRDRSDSLFVLFLALFLTHTSLIVWPVFLNRSIETNSPIYMMTALALATSLSAYTAKRSGKPWLDRFRKIVAVLSILIVATVILVKDGPETLRWPFALVRVFVAAVILTSVLPLMRQGGVVDVKRIPPKTYRIAGMLSIIFAVVLSIPVILGNQPWVSEDLHLITYLVFSALINLRFITYLLPRILRDLDGRRKVRDEAFEKFAISPREREVYDLLAKGYTYKEIARLLSISLATVKTHVDRLLKKTDSTNKVELILEIDR